MAGEIRGIHLEHKPGKKPANANSCKFSELQVSEPMPVDAVHQQDQPNNMTPFQSRSKEEVIEHICN